MADDELQDETRKKLINSLEQTLGLTVPPTTWAFLWLSDVPKLQELVDNSRIPGMQRDRKSSLAGTPVSATPIPSSQPSTPTSRTPSSSRPGSLKRKQGEVSSAQGGRKIRSSSGAAQCHLRDSGRCVITKDCEHDVAHIYPVSLHAQQAFSGPPEDSIWAALRYFWSEDRVEAWYNAIFSGGEFNDYCYNMICLSPSARRYYTKGYFALKPIAMSDDQKCLTVEFYWLQKSVRPEFVTLSEAPAIASLDQGPRFARLINHETAALIRSGDQIRIETEDPVNRPLPNWHLLEMQWTLNRVVAISAAADVENDYDDEDDNELMQEDDFYM